MSFCDVKWLSFFQAPVPEVTSECDPWSPVSRFKLAAEHALADVAELDYVIVRPALVYGPGDRMGLSEL